MLHLPSLMLAYHFDAATLPFSAAKGCLRHPPQPGFLIATWPCCLSPFYPPLSQKRRFERVHKICVVQSKYFVLPPHRSSNRPRFCDEKNVPLLHKTSPAAACSLTSKPAPKLNQRSPKIHILFLYFQNDCGFRTSLQLLTAAGFCFWRREQ